MMLLYAVVAPDTTAPDYPASQGASLKSSALRPRRSSSRSVPTASAPPTTRRERSQRSSATWQSQPLCYPCVFRPCSRQDRQC